MSSRSGGRGTEEGGTGEGTVLASASTGMGSAAEAGRTCRACRVRGAMRRRVQSTAEAEVGRSREDSRSARGRKAGEGARRSGTGRIGVDASMECRSDSVVAALFGVDSMDEVRCRFWRREWLCLLETISETRLVEVEDEKGYCHSLEPSSHSAQ